MAAPRKPRVGSLPAAPEKVPAGGEPIGRWAQVLADKAAKVRIEPFEVYPGLVVQPLTMMRARALSAAQRAYFTIVTVIAQAAQYGATAEEREQNQKEHDEALLAYNEALFGKDEFPLIERYFADRPGWEFDLFQSAVKEQFLRLPDDGKCPTCGSVVDEEAAGKEPESSTTSNTTGTTSKATSPENSTE